MNSITRDPTHDVWEIDEILKNYLNGFYPYWDSEARKFYWDRKQERTYVHLNAKSSRAAEGLLKSIHEKFEITEEKHVDEVIAALSDQKIKPASWVQGPVKAIYQTLHLHGYLVSLEVLNNEGLAGAILGVRFPRVLILETMFSRHAKSSASKAALAHVVLRYMERGFRIADVQVKHEKRHPAVKLGEVTRSIRTYVKLVQRLTQAEEVNQ